MVEGPKLQVGVPDAHPILMPILEKRLPGQPHRRHPILMQMEAKPQLGICLLVHLILTRQVVGRLTHMPAVGHLTHMPTTIDGDVEMRARRILVGLVIPGQMVAVGHGVRRETTTMVHIRRRHHLQVTSRMQTLPSETPQRLSGLQLSVLLHLGLSTLR